MKKKTGSNSASNVAWFKLQELSFRTNKATSGHEVDLVISFILWQLFQTVDINPFCNLAF